MNVFYIVRHGETENNKAKRLSGWVDTPLTVSGLASTEKAIAKIQNLPITKIYSSDLGRAFVTAYIVARRLKYTDEIVRLPGLREVNYGDVANMYTADAYAQYPQIDRDTHFIPPNGESLDHMQARVIATLDQLDNAHTDAVIVVVAHSGVMAALNARFRNTDFGDHNITVAYPHDYVAKCTVADGDVTSFEEVTAA
jgi:broad specificity phosphatase PhoE